MQYIIAPTEEHLEHSAKGTIWKNHKYIKKVGSRYVYPTKKAIGVKASQAKQVVTSGASKVASNAKKAASSVSKAASKAASSVGDTASSVKNTAASAISKAIDKLKDINIDDVGDNVTIFSGDDGKESFRVTYSAPTDDVKDNTKDLKKKTTKHSTTFYDDDDKERFKVKYH